MSVTTAADEALNRARQSINEAIKQLSNIIVERCWGFEEFKASKRSDIEETFYDLIKIRDKL